MVNSNFGFDDKEKLAVQNHVQTVYKAMRFLSSNGHRSYSEQDMIGFVRNGKLTPFFYYNFKLNDRDLEAEYDPLEDHGGMRHGIQNYGEGFIQMFDHLSQKSAPNISNIQIRTIPSLDAMVRYEHAPLPIEEDGQDQSDEESFSLQEYLNSEYTNQTDSFSKFEISTNNASYSCKFRATINNRTWYGNIIVSYISGFDVSDSEFLSHCYFDEEQLQILLNDYPEKPSKQKNLKNNNVKHQELLKEALSSPQVEYAAKLLISNQNRDKATKRHAKDYATNEKAIKLWQVDRQNTYTAFADKYYLELKVTHDTVRRWIGEYERDKKTNTASN